MTRLLGLLAVLAVAGAAGGQPPPDPDVQPAQFTEPVPVPNPVPVGGIGPRGLPAMPPTPVVQVMVLAPRDAHGEKPIEYTIRVVNQTGARANGVRVRVPWPDGADQITKAEPNIPGTKGKELVWSLGTLDGNSTTTITFSVKPVAGAAELSVRAYVQFEHGQQVVTKLSAPKLMLKADAPKQGSADTPVPVRLTVSNTGRVPAVDTKLTVTISPGFEFAKEDGGEATKEPNQRVWEVGTLPPGGNRTLNLRVRPKDGRELTLLAGVNSSNAAADKAEAKVKVLESGLKLTLDGDPKTVNGMASYTAVVRNTGGLPLTNVRISGSIPDDCRPAGKTSGSRITPTAIEWVIPRLAPDEAYEVRWRLESTGSGRRTVRAVATAGAIEDKGSVETVFVGSPQLSWTQKFDQGSIRVDQRAMLTVTVSNRGTAAATGRVTIDLPESVSFEAGTPKDAKRDGRRVSFPAEAVGPGETREYTLSFKGESAGPAYFEMQLDGDGLDGKPLTARKAVEVTGRR